MSKLSSKSDVIEWYWPDFLYWCMKGNWTMGNTLRPVKGSYNQITNGALPTEDNFWLWYITDGPLGLKDRQLYYNKEDVQYV